MKAKHYYMCFKSCDTTEKLNQNIERCVLDLVKDTEDLIVTRCAKSKEAIASCIKEVNQKWLALIRIHNENQNKLDHDHPLKFVGFNEEGFKAIFVSIHPEYSWAFEANDFKKKLDEIQKEKEKAFNNFTPYKVKPFEELDKTNLYEEYTAICYALSMYFNYGFPVESLQPLADRANLIRKWIDNDCTIDPEDIKAYNERWRKENAESN